jgi:hypothetical protein
MVSTSFQGVTYPLHSRLREIFWISKKVFFQSNTTVVNAETMQNFLKFFSGGFEARHFNSMKEDSFVITKTSLDIIKMEKEFN